LAKQKHHLNHHKKQQEIKTSYELNTITFIDADNGLVVGGEKSRSQYRGIIFHTTDGGEELEHPRQQNNRRAFFSNLYRCKQWLGSWSWRNNITYHRRGEELEHPGQ